MQEPTKILFWFGLVLFLLDLLLNTYTESFQRHQGVVYLGVKALLMGKLDYKKWLNEFFAKFSRGNRIGAGLSLGRRTFSSVRLLHSLWSFKNF